MLVCLSFLFCCSGFSRWPSLLRCVPCLCCPRSFVASFFCFRWVFCLAYALPLVFRFRGWIMSLRLSWCCCCWCSASRGPRVLWVCADAPRCLGCPSVSGLASSFCPSLFSCCVSVSSAHGCHVVVVSVRSCWLCLGGVMSCASSICCLSGVAPRCCLLPSVGVGAPLPLVCVCLAVSVLSCWVLTSALLVTVPGCVCLRGFCVVFPA